MSLPDHKERVVIFMGPFKSHFNCAFSMARGIQEKYHVIFVGPLFLSEFVTNQGWSFRSIPLTFLHPKISLRLFISRLLEGIVNSSSGTFLMECEEILATIKSLSPKILFIDAHVSRYHSMLKQLGIKTAVVQPMLAGHKDKGIPPMNSKHVPSGNKWSNFYVELLWLRFFLKKRVLRSFFHIGAMGITNAALIKKLKGYNKKDFDHATAGPPIIRGVEEIRLYSSQIDFPWRKEKKNEIYFGPSVDVSRVEVVDPELLQYITRIKCTESAKFIYCSFGSLSPAQNKSYHFFISSLLKIADQNPSWFFLIAADGHHKFKEKSNAKFVRYAPQLKALQHADIMITHGGLNTMQECIVFSVPMLVYPFVSFADHYGVSARILYHKLGISGNIYRDSPKQIAIKVRHLLANDFYKTNLNALNLKIKLLNEKKQFDLWMNRSAS